MAGQRSRKEKPATLNKRNTTGDDSANTKRNETNDNDRNYFFYPDSEAMKHKDNEIHFLRFLSLAAVLAVIMLFAFHRYKVAQLKVLLKAKDEQYIGALTGGVVSAEGDISVYAKIVDQFVSLVYIIAIMVGVITWWLKVSEY